MGSIGVNMGQIRFIKIREQQIVADYFFDEIKTHLESGRPVLWLIAGGSAIDIAVNISNRLEDLKNLNNLYVSLTDERYGPPGHTDSNWKQLKDSGFKLPGANLFAVLNGSDSVTTANEYASFLNHHLNNEGYSIALAGMGADGHIFGIKPGSPSTNDKEEVVAYEWDDYTRITPTFRLLKKIDEVVIYAVGSEKHRQFDLLKKDISSGEQPAQLLKQCKKVTIFNDYIGTVSDNI
jgi:6-phosphogluconolactonase/glucosamine-6-phosphate isomerase/deaminase